MANEITNADDFIDSRDVIERIEELRTELEDAHEGQGNDISFGDWLAEMADDSAGTLQDAAVEYLALKAFADEAEGYASDWLHGATLIRETHFVEYVEEMLKDIGDVPQDLPGYLVIDWEATAENIKVDYTEIEFDGVAYLVR